MIRVDKADNEFVFAISDRLSVDEVQALVLLRSFLYNESLPPTTDDPSTSSTKVELLEAITPFYYSDDCHFYASSSPYRAKENSSDSLHVVESKILPLLVPDGVQFATTLITTYSQKLKYTT